MKGGGKASQGADLTMVVFLLGVLTERYLKNQSLYIFMPNNAGFPVSTVIQSFL